MMTVKQLVERLQQYPGEAEVTTEGCDCEGEVSQAIFYGEDNEVYLVRPGGCWEDEHDEGGPMTQMQKEWIDQAPYQALLQRWRYSPAGDAFFQGEKGDYYAKVMSEKKSALSGGEQVAASKAVG